MECMATTKDDNERLRMRAKMGMDIGMEKILMAGLD